MAGYCPSREQTRPDTGPKKSRAGRRVVVRVRALPESVPSAVTLSSHPAISADSAEAHIAAVLLDRVVAKVVGSTPRRTECSAPGMMPGSAEISALGSLTTTLPAESICP